MTRLLVVPGAKPEYLEAEVNKAITEAEADGWSVSETFPMQFTSNRYGVTINTTAIGISLWKSDSD